MKSFFYLLACCLAWLFSGCVLFQDEAKVAAFAARERYPKEFRYFLKSGMSGVSEKDLEFLNYSKTLESMLAAKNYRVVPEEDANCVVYLSYEISDPETIYDQHSTPIYGTVAYAGPRGNPRPVMGVVAYEQTTTSRNRYTCRLNLECWAWESGKAKEQLWKTSAFSYTHSSDLGEYFPFLAWASFPWIGENSNGQKRVRNFAEDAEQDLKTMLKAN